MSKIYTSAAELIGHTPLLELSNLEKTLGLKAKIIAISCVENVVFYFFKAS